MCNYKSKRQESTKKPHRDPLSSSDLSQTQFDGLIWNHDRGCCVAICRLVDFILRHSEAIVSWRKVVQELKYADNKEEREKERDEKTINKSPPTECSAKYSPT
jgi:hypothetical protein